MKQTIFRIIADLRFSIFILLLISLVSIFGTIIEQDQPVEIYQTKYPFTNSVLGFLTWDRILQFGLDHVYQTWWFFSLIFLFGSSLLCCTFLQQLPSLKIARRCQFFRTTQPFYQLKLSTRVRNRSFHNILVGMKHQNYSLFQQKNMIYGYKGLSGRMAPILVHGSMILILLGTISGSLFGFQAQEIIPKTENFHIQNVVRNGPWITLPKTAGRINDFWITYSKTKTISQFYSDLSILNPQGKEMDRKTISVNHPLVYQNIYYYQTDWNLIGLRFQTVSQERMEYPLVNFASTPNKIWLTWIPKNNSLEQGVIAIIENLEGYCSIYNEGGSFLGNLELQESTTLDGRMIFSEILSSTGLQIKEDTGIPMIYTGFFFLMISTLISYITYSQIWILEKDHERWIGGTTNRARFDFEVEFWKVIQ